MFIIGRGGVKKIKITDPKTEGLTHLTYKTVITAVSAIPAGVIVLQVRGSFVDLRQVFLVIDSHQQD